MTDQRAYGGIDHGRSGEPIRVMRRMESEEPGVDRVRAAKSRRGQARSVRAQVQRAPDPNAAGGPTPDGEAQAEQTEDEQLDPKEQEQEAEDKGGEPQVKGGSSPAPAQAASGPAPGAPGVEGQARLEMGSAGDRYEQEADRVADQVVEVGLREVGGGSTDIPTPTLQRMPEISSMGAAPMMSVQKLDAEAIEARAAVVQLTAQFVGDVANQTADDVTWSFDRMNAVKHPGDNTNWGLLTGVRWQRHFKEFEWYRVNGFGTKTGMTVRLNWEGNGYSMSGVYFTKRSHNDAAGWGAEFTWLVQNLMTTGTNAAGHPKARVAWECTAAFTRTLASTIHGNWDGWIDAEGDMGQNPASVSGGAGTGGGMPSAR